MEQQEPSCLHVWPRRDRSESYDFHKLTGWGNWLSTNTQQLNKNPEKGGGGKLEDSAKN